MWETLFFGKNFFDGIRLPRLVLRLKLIYRTRHSWLLYSICWNHDYYWLTMIYIYQDKPCKSIFFITQCMQEKNVRETESVCAWYSAYVKCATAPTCNSTSVSFCSVYIHSHILLLVCGSVCMYIYVYLYMYVLSVWSCHLSKITMRMDKTFPWGQWLRLGTKF